MDEALNMETPPKSHLDLKGMEFHEDDDVITLKYQALDHRFDMIYHKEKDKVLVLKDKKPANLDQMTPYEVDCYKEALEICICYHHNRADEPLH